MKVIFDTNIWISFLIGHQNLLMKRMLTDVRFDIVVCHQLIDEIINVANRDKIRRWVTQQDLQDLLDVIHAFCISATIDVSAPITAIRDPKDVYLICY